MLQSWKVYILNGCTRMERKFLIRQCTYVLITASIPVFIAAGISSFVTPIIEYIAHEHGNVDAVETGLSFLYAILAYIIGKQLTHLVKATELSTPDSWLIQRLKSEKTISILYGLFAENSAFAWKEFLIIFLLKYLYNEHAFGASFGGWLMMVTIFLSFSAISIFWEKKLIKNLHIYHHLLEFDEEAFALSIAFTWTVIFTFALQGLGVVFISDDSYLYHVSNGESDGEHTDDDHSHSPQGNFYFLYASIITLAVSIFLVVERKVIEQYSPQTNHTTRTSDESQNSIPLNAVASSKPNSEYVNHAHDDQHGGKTTTWSEDVLDVYYHQWHHCLG
jgi:hypothetical protein